MEDGTQFFNLTSIPPAQERLQFQLGDVIGWYIHTLAQATDQPLSIVYSHATSDENAVDLFSMEISDLGYSATQPPCDVATCSTNTALISSVIPYITVDYGKLGNPVSFSALSEDSSFTVKFYSLNRDPVEFTRNWKNRATSLCEQLFPTWSSQLSCDNT